MPNHRKGKRRRNDEEKPGAPEELFYPVVCSVCEAHLGVQDAEELFHLYHVVASTA